MNPEHAILLAELRKAARPARADLPPQNDSYGGSGRPYYFVSVPDRRGMVRRWLAANKALAADEILAVVDSLSQGESHEEAALGGMLLRDCPKARRAVTTAELERWLGRLNGWAEVDTWCQNLFTAQDMAADWPAWSGLIERLSRDPNINRRRAALVLLNGPAHYSPDPRFSDLAFVVLERLKAEKPILITKAVSWLLRSLVTRHRDAVAAYLDANQATLPAIAVRETRTKLKTGTKSGRSKPA
ncbi:MAG TPA: DNA alkylation repair protein [Caulobacteraceae bacterium]|nr:DNA alkylation repair protein [Caulobacteraceae bacterium]